MKNKDLEFQRLYEKAYQAGLEAGRSVTPTPMAVQMVTAPGLVQVMTGESAGFNPNRPYDIVSEGACGFAWVSFAGNTAFGRWARKSGVARPGYPTGLRFWIGAHGQSIARKEAHAEAMAAVLREAGIKAYADSRLD